jgi:hypothetical protein
VRGSTYQDAALLKAKNSSQTTTEPYVISYKHTKNIKLVIYNNCGNIKNMRHM